MNAGDGRVFEFCLNNPEETSDEICPEYYRCGSEIPRCDGDEDCPGGMFGCDAATCVVPSITACEGKEAGTPCSRMVNGSAVEGFCSGMDLCLPACVSDEEVRRAPDFGRLG